VGGQTYQKRNKLSQKKVHACKKKRPQGNGHEASPKLGRRGLAKRGPRREKKGLLAARKTERIVRCKKKKYRPLKKTRGREEDGTWKIGLLPWRTSNYDFKGKGAVVKGERISKTPYGIRVRT